MKRRTDGLLKALGYSYATRLPSSALRPDTALMAGWRSGVIMANGKHTG
ncbi:hypothetical protein ACLBKT_08780 [Erythrobacter sp. W302b]